jgi:hypothetical protein
VEATLRTRRKGGGRKPLTEHDSKLGRALEILVDPVTRGDPMSPLRWTWGRKLGKETRTQARKLGRSKFPSLIGKETRTQQVSVPDRIQGILFR